MENKHAIEFHLRKDDEPLNIQLEPECLIYKVSPGNEIKFIAVNCDADFHWSLRVANKERWVQLFPESKGNYDIEIYENGSLLEDWFKYM
ncbi:hypothetical protein [Mucilaginibacter sp. 3215]|uniref:hypothetical protein n=1 Tax=Mucilaginibacter sp. 3215 TaxID=3373912 RepID=UPI003D1E9F3C